MNRIQIKEALYNTAKQLGYQPLILSEKELQQNLEALPTIWVQPLKLKDVEGRKSGRITYTINVAAISFAGDQSPENKCDSLSKMEEDLLQLLCELNQNEVVAAVENICITPTTKQLTKHNDLSIMAQADVITLFEQ